MVIVKRVILKISGELFGDNNNHIDFEKYDNVAKQLVEIQNKTEIELVVVVGGGNIFRGRQAKSMVDSNEADSMGMLATIINGIGLREALVRNGKPDTRLMTAVAIPGFAEPYIRNKGRHHLNNNRIVIIAGGLGMPGFSTDSAVAQYAGELQCEMIFKASTVDGIYDSDPKTNKNAKKYIKITHKQAIDERLKIMDATAFTMCERDNMPIFVFNIKDLYRLPEIIAGDYSFGTLIEK
ncbi:UMP kinase [Candidatus Shapirobacteria bacterium CG_4_8_14_3_um_filter_35_11]|uniref:Uridylate kinase n=4 Tax=Candidatus Shapironibacteriota TaxID=1752721 RepID=A0A1J5I495_9BACT|nr:MAG: hypothetical protein AUK05_01755 [Candidatus Shapirobacteria bacterium CG2_30_35_20]PIV06878.1 MAG: UMP kinase [Candidatus Shapirobacteria bacterium CG03_land_8_20_14_0_80_35_14]PJA51339.1 MAG: UMP kinase [Candidatus Shapirobacteria bacterium CG_4_9_14_3_um_filter_36_12]PJC80281.1 MAG: UMP kinase [Candidatus Shapirobacteria bacterium CG_4_8_14_3_um_filter_35_11]